VSSTRTPLRNDDVRDQGECDTTRLRAALERALAPLGLEHPADTRAVELRFTQRGTEVAERAIDMVQTLKTRLGSEHWEKFDVIKPSHSDRSARGGAACARPFSRGPTRFLAS
jgi:hypothetical protein